MSILDFLLPYSWMKNVILKCPSCQLRFSTDAKEKIYKRPVLLQCSHVVCENCTYHKAKPLVCDVCQTETSFETGKSLSSIQQPYNFYLTGLINYIDYGLPYREKLYKESKQQQRPVSTKTTNVPKAIVCLECNNDKNLVVCMECEHPYCIPCFNNIHRQAKVLKDHTHHSVTSMPKNKLSGYLKDVRRKYECKEHNIHMTHFCTDCQISSCLCCNLEKHGEHNVISLKIENEKHRNLLLSLISKLDAAKESTDNAKKIIAEIQESQDDYILETISNISNFFIHLHGIVENAEIKVMRTLQATFKNYNDKLNALKESLQQRESWLDNDINLLKSYRHSMPKNVKISADLQHIDKLLTNLVPVNVDAIQHYRNPITFNKLKSLECEINSLFELKLTDLQDFTYIPANTCGEYLDKTLTNGVASLNSTLTKNPKVKRQRTNTVSTETSNKSERKQPMKTHASLTEKLKTHQVNVTYIVSATHFYVQLKSSVTTSAEFFVACNEEGRIANKVPQEIKEDTLYLIWWSRGENRGFYRGKIIELKENRLYDVLFVDYGRTAQMEKTDFREMSLNLRAEPVGAILCSLYDVKSKKSLLHEQVQVMSNILANECVTMIVLHENPRLKIVDLFTQKDHRISLRDALLFAEYVEPYVEIEYQSKIPTINEYKNRFLYTKLPKKIFKNTFTSGQYFRVDIKHCISPHEFYAMKKDYESTIETMSEELNKFYSQSSCNLIYYPREQMSCAVLSANNVYYRGRIEKVLPHGNCEVFLTEIGRKEIVHWKKIFDLHDQFLPTNEGVIKCKLADIQSTKEHNYQWSKESIEKFQSLCLSSCLQIYVSKHDTENNMYYVTLYIVQANRDICINAMLVNDKDCVSTGFESIREEIKRDMNCDQDPSKTSDNIVNITDSAKKFKVNKYKVNIRNVISPSEFYVFYKKQTFGFANLHRRLQRMTLTKHNSTTNKSWNVTDKCLVKTIIPTESQPQVYRCIIEAMKDSEIFTVFLMDIGIYIDTFKDQLYENIDEKIKIFAGGVIKCHLACVCPTAGQSDWSAYVKDEFKCIMKEYEDFAISIHKSINKTKTMGSSSVFLWGMTSTCAEALTPAIAKWTNINKLMVDRGIFHMTEKIEVENIDDAVFNFADLAKILNEIDLILKDDDECVENEHVLPKCMLSDHVTRIDDWLPPLPISKTLFPGIPTYIDDNGIIYLHHVDNGSLIDEIKLVINDKYKGDAVVDKSDLFWGRGEPCLARFHLDKLYYRGKIVDNTNQEILKVEFIDYGNVEECVRNDLRKEIILGDVPSQANKFYLGKLQPFSSKWPTATLDYIHGHIVGKICNIRTETGEPILNDNILPCSIKFENFDLAEILVDRNMVKPRNYQKKHNVSIKSHKLQNQSIADNKSKQQSHICERFRRNNSLYNEFNDNYNDISINRMDDQASVVEESICLKDLDIADVDAFVKETNIIENNISLDSEQIFHTSDAFETSTQIEDSYNCSPYKFLKMSNDTHGFYCDVAKVVAPLDIFLTPYASKHDEKCRELIATMQTIALIAPVIKDISTGVTCLAFDTTHSRWYRGIIQSCDIANDMVTVFIVDTLKVAKFKSKDIRKCPRECRNFPLRNIRVRLTGVKPNIRFRKSDVQAKMDRTLQDMKVYMKIVYNDEIPSVKLYLDNKCKVLAYRDLIEKKYLVLD